MRRAIIGIIIAALVAIGGYGIYRGVSNNGNRNIFVKEYVQNSGDTNNKPNTNENNMSTKEDNTSTQDNNTQNNSPAETMTPAEALNLLKEGNKRFVEDKSQLNDVNAARRKELESGQHPYATVVACSDSRITPNIVFNAGLGEIFDIRLAGDVVDDAALGSIEYAVEHLHTPIIVVMGHENCGAVTAAYDDIVNGQKVHGHIKDLVEDIKPAINKDETIDQAIRKNAENVANEIREDPVVAQAIKEGKTEVVTAYYDLDGTVQFNS